MSAFTDCIDGFADKTLTLAKDDLRPLIAKIRVTQRVQQCHLRLYVAHQRLNVP